jgi:hypothetical protein
MQVRKMLDIYRESNNFPKWIVFTIEEFANDINWYNPLLNMRLNRRISAINTLYVNKYLRSLSRVERQH